MGEASTSILHQIVRLQPKVEPGALIVLSCSRIEKESRFLESIAWGFPYALRVIYKDQSIDGIIIRQGEPYRKMASEIHLVHTNIIDDKPIITSVNEDRDID